MAFLNVWHKYAILPSPETSPRSGTEWALLFPLVHVAHILLGWCLRASHNSPPEGRSHPAHGAANKTAVATAQPASASVPALMAKLPTCNVWLGHRWGCHPRRRPSLWRSQAKKPREKKWWGDPVRTQEAQSLFLLNEQRDLPVVSGGPAQSLLSPHYPKNSLSVEDFPQAFLMQQNECGIGTKAREFAFLLPRLLIECVPGAVTLCVLTHWILTPPLRIWWLWCYCFSWPQRTVDFSPHPDLLSGCYPTMLFHLS